MQIISAGRRTGKTTYAKLIQKTNSVSLDFEGIYRKVIVVVPDGMVTSMDIYTRDCDTLNASSVLNNEHVDRDRGINPYWQYLYILEEPGCYEEGQLSKLLSTIAESQILLIIGTPAFNSEFDKYLQYNINRVVRWAAPMPEEPYGCNISREYFGEFEEI